MDALNIAREGFIYRGAAIFNKLDENLRNETKLQKFKDGLKEWVKTNITVRPKSSFQSISAGRQSNQPPPPPEPPPPPQPPPRSQPVRMRSIQHYFPPAKPPKQAAPLDDQAL